MKILKSIRLVLLTAFIAGAFIFTVSCNSKGSSNPSGSEAELKLTSLKIFGQDATNGTLEVENDKSELKSSDIVAVFDYASEKSKKIAVNVNKKALAEGKNEITLSIPAVATQYKAWSKKITITRKAKNTSSEAELKLMSLKIFGQEVKNGTLEVENDKSELNSSDIEAVFDYASEKSKKIKVNVSNGTLAEGKNEITLSIPAVPTQYKAWSKKITITRKAKNTSSEAELKLTSLKIFGKDAIDGTLEVENDKSELKSSDIVAFFDYASEKSKKIKVNVSNGTLAEGKNEITLSIPAVPTQYKAWSKEITITRKGGKYTKVKFSDLETYLKNTAQSTEGAKENCIEISLTEDDLKIPSYSERSLVNIIEKSGKKIELKLSGDAITDENMPSFFYCKKTLKSIDLSECTNLKNIKKYAFEGCWELESFKASQELESIGENAFAKCLNLKTIDLSQYPNLTTISPYAFYQSSYLDAVNLNGCSKLETIGEGAFDECKRLKSIDLSGCKNLKKIGQIAFKDCEKLESIDLSMCTELEFIGKGLFAGCTRLTRADLSGLAKLKILGSIDDYDRGEGLFEGCSNLSEIKLDGCSSIEEICEKAFYACEKLERIDLSSCSNLKKLGLPYNVSGKINGVFESCSNLTEIKLDGASLEEICEKAFKDCKKLSAMDLSMCSKLSKIEKNMFENCEEIKSITLPNTITEIGGSAFQNCAALENIDLSNLALTSIGGQAFYGCKTIETIDLSKSIDLTNLGGYGPFYACTNLKSIDLSNCSKLNVIGASGFYRCENLESLDLAHCKNLKEIKSDTFVDCENLTVRLPDSITEIAKGAFGDPDKCYNGNCQTRCKKVRVPNDDIKTKVVNANYPEENIEI